VDYLDFELDIGADDEGRYEVTARSCAGEVGRPVRLAVDLDTVDQRLRMLKFALLSVAAVARRTAKDEERTVQEFGRDLLGSVLDRKIRTLFEATRERAKDVTGDVRIVLHVRPPELARLPWETCWDDETQTYLSLRFPMVRSSDVSAPVRTLEVSPPLRVLCMVASPRGLPRLDAEAEQARMEDGLADLVAADLIRLTWLRGGSWRELQRTVRTGQYHVFHFIGHGDYDVDADTGVLQLCDDGGDPYPLPGDDLRDLLARTPQLRLVLLNACSSAQSSKRDAFSSTAATLVRDGVPAVVAMQFPITDRAALEFSRSFYAALADGSRVDDAVRDARNAVKHGQEGSLEWAVPVLYLNSAEARLFELAPVTREPVQREPVQREPVQREPVQREPDQPDQPPRFSPPEHPRAREPADTSGRSAPSGYPARPDRSPAYSSPSTGPGFKGQMQDIMAAMRDAFRAPVPPSTRSGAPPPAHPPATGAGRPAGPPTTSPAAPDRAPEPGAAASPASTRAGQVPGTAPADEWTGPGVIGEAAETRPVEPSASSAGGRTPAAAPGPGFPADALVRGSAEDVAAGPGPAAPRHDGAPLGRAIFATRLPFPVWVVALGFDGSVLAGGRTPDRVFRWAVPSGEPLRPVLVQGGVSGAFRLAVAADAPYVAVVTWAGPAIVPWESPVPSPVSRVPLALSADGRRVVVTRSDGSLEVQDGARSVRAATRLGRSAVDLDADGDSGVVAVACDDGRAWLWHPASGDRLVAVQSSWPVSVVRVSAGGRRAVVAGAAGVALVDTGNGRVVAGARLSGVPLLAAGSRGCAAWVTGNWLGTLPPHGGEPRYDDLGPTPVGGIAIRADRVVLGYLDGRVEVREWREP
jgi:CHAT domain-containing protein